MYGLGNLGNKITAFTQRVVDATQYLKDKNANILANQFFRSGTSIGANCSEAVYAVSKADYLNKLLIALKETNETIHWIQVMYMSKLIDKPTYLSIKADCEEIAKILATITKNIKQSISK
ncbi:MAG: four helix bundle protein [Bacteroidales bacterium]|nr:four helix bundle protein [Bacteroidales bacterium]